MAPHYFGWLPSPPDQRDYLYAAPGGDLGALPEKVDLDAVQIPSPWTPLWQQAALGSCGPNSLAADLVYGLLRQQGDPSCPMPSRLFLYWNTRELMGTTGQDSGVNNRAMLKALAAHGWCDEELWPYDITAFRQRPPRNCYEQGLTRRGIEYLSVPQDLGQMKACLAGGDPFIFGFSVYQSLESASVKSSGDVPMPGMGERSIGGHDVLIQSFDDATQRFGFRNSWGTGWGNGGRGTIPYAYATNPRLAGDFWTVRYQKKPAPPPPVPVPNPPGPPLDGGIGVRIFPVSQVVEIPQGWTARTVS